MCMDTTLINYPKNSKKYATMINRMIPLYHYAYAKHMPDSSKFEVQVSELLLVAV